MRERTVVVVRCKNPCVSTPGTLTTVGGLGFSLGFSVGGLFSLGLGFGLLS